jgi:hypothetical protein
MEDIQQIIVNEHIDGLRRDAQGLRSDRQLRHLPNGARGRPAAAGSDRPGPRVRLGHWLIGVGMAVSGTAGDPNEGAAGQAT